MCADERCSEEMCAVENRVAEVRPLSYLFICLDPLSMLVKNGIRFRLRPRDSVDVRTVDRWLEEGATSPYGDAVPRLRFTYQLIIPLADHDKPAVVQPWRTGINPELKDRTPIRLLPEQDLEVVGPELLGAQRAFSCWRLAHLLTDRTPGITQTG
jgi:hypothetical protein